MPGRITSRLVLLLALVVLGVWLPRGSALVSTAREAVTVVSAPGVVVGSQPIAATFRLAHRLHDAEAFFVVYPETTSVSGLGAVLSGAQLGYPIGITHAVAVSPHASQMHLVVPDPIPASGCGTSCSGVYPVQLRVASAVSGQTLASVTFAVPYFSTLSGVVPLHLAVGVIAETPAVTASAIEELLARDPSVQVGVSAEGPVGLGALRSLAHAVPLRASLLAPTVGVARACVGALGPLSSFASSVQLARTVVGTASAPLAFATVPTSDELESLRALGIHEVILPASALASASPVLTLSNAVRLGAGVVALGTSAMVSDGLSSVTQPLGAQLLMAELAQVYFEAPSRPGRVLAGLVAVASDARMAAFARGLASLGSLPFLQLSTIDGAMATASSTVVRPNVAAERACPRPLEALRVAARRAAALAEAAPGVRPELTALVLGALAHPEASQLARHAIDRTLDAITVASDQLTLTSARETVPIDITSHLSVPASIRVVLVDTKLRFPEGSTRTVTVASKTVTVPIPVVARTLGTSPLLVRLESPSGQLIGQNVLVVDSTGFSVVGVVLTGSSAALLAVWWVRNRGRRQRGRHAKRS